MTVLVTDHHEIPFKDVDGERIYMRSEADAIVNPHQKTCTFPYKDLCGAGVAWAVIVALYEKNNIEQREVEDLLEFVAFATVGDIMSLTGLNRILVKDHVLMRREDLIRPAVHCAYLFRKVRRKRQRLRTNWLC